MMVRAFSLLATWLGLIVQLRVANAATSNYRKNRKNSTVAEFGGVIFLGGWWDIRPGVDGQGAAVGQNTHVFADGVFDQFFGGQVPVGSYILKAQF